MCRVGLADRAVRIDYDINMHVVFGQQHIGRCRCIAIISLELAAVLQGGARTVGKRYSEFAVRDGKA